MQIAQINAFLSVAEFESFSLAAEQLHITQPAVSKRISQLEESLGTRLFDRVGKRSLLTPKGQLFKPHAEQIFLSLQTFKEDLSNTDNQPTGTLTLATSHHIGLHRLPPYLREFKIQFPQVDLDLHFMDSEDACHAIADNVLEIAVVTLPRHPDDRLHLQEIWKDDMKIVLAQDHPLANESLLTPEMLKAHPAILPSEGTFTRKIINNLFTLNRDGPKVVLETNYLETIKVMVSANLGWSMLPVNMIHDKSVIAKPLGIDPIYRPLGIVTHRQRTLSTSSMAMIDLLTKRDVHQP